VELKSPKLSDINHLYSIPDNSTDMSGGKFMYNPIIYHFNATWYERKDKIEINYCYQHFPEIDIRNRPIKKHINYPYILYDTVNNYYPIRIRRGYYRFFGTTIPNSIYNNVMKGKIIISLDDE